jgi:3-deoxy-manno-octulosonate cytidylyltransferase (CMP-KDO synthetase)
MSVWGVIPARFGSTRFPGKPLVKIQGLELVAWVIRAAKTSRLLDQVAVATDDQRIADVANREGVLSVMTNSNLPSGSDRVWTAVQGKEAHIVLNIQGDEPLITGALIDSLVLPMLQDRDLEMATLAHPISLQELRSEHSVKVVVNAKSEALYFSRFAIPYSRVPASDENIAGALKHIGMYAYKAEFLRKYCAQAPVEIENAEALEQLRALHMGARIKVIQTEQRSWGVDTPEDVKKIESLLKNQSGGSHG